jgi:hypothetical protein
VAPADDVCVCVCVCVCVWCGVCVCVCASVCMCVCVVCVCVCVQGVCVWGGGAPVVTVSTCHALDSVGRWRLLACTCSASARARRADTTGRRLDTTSATCRVCVRLERDRVKRQLGSHGVGIVLPSCILWLDIAGTACKGCARRDCAKDTGEPITLSSIQFGNVVLELDTECGECHSVHPPPLWWHCGRRRRASRCCARHIMRPCLQ